MSGIVGKIRRRFCLFGSTVNAASRTETSCPPGGIQITAATRELAVPFILCNESDSEGGGGRDCSVEIVDRGPIVVKGIDQPLNMYLVIPKHTVQDL